MGKGVKKHRTRAGGDPVVPRVERPTVWALPAREDGGRAADPTPTADPAAGTKKVKKCCRSTPRCKGCPVVLLRTRRLRESGLTGKDLKKAVKRARAA